MLDTHVLLWALRDPEKLPAAVSERIRDPENELIISAGSAWEISTKQRIGKLPGSEAILAAYPENLARLRASELQISSRHALAAGQLNWDHRDPFDRLLAAQSMLEGIPLVTGDAAFHAVPGVQTIWG